MSNNDNPFKINDNELFNVDKESRDKEDELIFNEEQSDQVKQTATNNFLGSSFNSSKAFYFFILACLVFLVIFSKLFYIQIINNDHYYTLAENNRQRVIPIPSKRGLIYDRFGNKLTENIPRFSLAITPQDLPHTKKERNRVIKKLSDLTNQSDEKLKEIIDEYRGYNFESIVIKENIDYETALSIQISASNLPGIHIQRGSKRLYHLKSGNKKVKSLSHILGYLGKINPDEIKKLSEKYLPSDYIGKTGLEQEYENTLRGSYGRKVVEVNSMGKRQKVISKKSPRPGDHLKLSIDTKIQAKLEQLLKKYKEEKDYQKASAIVLDPNNGEVLSLVSFPAYDNNVFTGDINEKKLKKYKENPNNPLFNRSISGEYPPGSTIKPMIGAGALQEDIIEKGTVIESTGGIEVGNHFFPDWKEGGHGYTNITKAIAWSVNTFYYYIGGGYEDFEGLGLSGIRKYLQKFGFSQKTGIDLPNESTGFLPTKKWKRKNKEKKWFIGDTYNLSIGQGDLLVTPIQIANATAAIANFGTLYKPFIVKKIIDPVTDEIVVQNKTKIKSNIIKKNNLRIVRQGMLECVVYGSCQRLDSLSFNLGGKTGTAQWSNSKKSHAWFTSFAPYEDPEIVLTILVEQGGSGDDTAIPIAHDFYKWWGNYKSKEVPRKNIID
ncbi:MAG: penicillin-binding protein 2 [Candidatus Magasanikbacteria bacterium]